MSSIKNFLKRIPGIVSLAHFIRVFPSKISNSAVVLSFFKKWWSFVFWIHRKLNKNGQMFLGGGLVETCSVFSYCERTDMAKNIKVIKSSRIRRRNRLPNTRGEYETGTTEIIDKSVVPIYVAELENVCVVGDCDYLLKDNYYLNDILEYNDISNMQDAHIPLKLKKYDQGIGLSNIDIKKAVELECGIDLVKMWSGNYYHFTIESLSRLQYVDQLPEYKGYPLLIDEAVLASEHYQELVALFNDKNREVICIKPNQAYKVKKLVYPSAHSWHYIVPFDGEIVKGDTVIDYDGIKNFKEAIEQRKCFESKIKCGKKLFLTRGNNSRFLNDSEVGKYLAACGFDIVDPGWMSLDEKIEMFSDVDVVVGAMGTQFMNLLYAPRGCRAYIICPYELQDRAFDDYLDAIGIQYTYVDCRIVKLGGTVNTSTFRISLKDIYDALENIMTVKI